MRRIEVDLCLGNTIPTQLEVGHVGVPYPIRMLPMLNRRAGSPADIVRKVAGVSDAGYRISVRRRQVARAARSASVLE